MQYFFPEINNLQGRAEKFFTIYGGKSVFNSFRVVERNKSSRVISTSEVTNEFLSRFISKPNSTLGLNFETPLVMGILNVTPDSFYDGEELFSEKQFVEKGLDLLKIGCSILDVGGESTRPGAKEISSKREIERVIGVIEKIKMSAPSAMISVDTRKALVAEKALQSGASLVNDISAGSFDKKMFNVVAKYKAGICLMHSKGLPENMQNKPYYDNVLFDIYDYFEKKISQAECEGIPKEKILIDPGIGFGKSLSHNIEIIKKVGLFIGLGCPIIIGPSRKSFIGEIIGEKLPSKRLAGSIAAMLVTFSNGVNIVRVHDVKETVDAMKVWNILK
jgi:dihydropteroate synthase